MNHIFPVDGLLVFDNRLKVHSFNQSSSVKFLNGKPEDQFDRIEKLLRINEKFSIYLEHMLEQNIPYAIQYFDLELPDGSKTNFLVLCYLSVNPDNQKLLHVMFKEDKSEDESRAPLNKNLKFNSIRKLAPSVAHEIRNPLSTLAIQKQIIDNILTSLPLSDEQLEKVKKSLKILDTELDRVIKLIDQFFSLIRSESHEPTYEDLNSLLREVYDLVRQYCYENAINLELKLEKNIPFIYVNRDHFILVLLNLIINSIETMPKRGTLIFRSDTKDKKGIIYIQDTGNGLDDHQKDHILGKTSESSVHDDAKSLSDARRIIRDMNGDLRCESEPGVGTTFMIELPTISKF